MEASNNLTDEQVRNLAAWGALITPLPFSPYIKVKKTGEIHPWTEFFAERPDLCVNCDESGNEDPAAWSGKLPESLSKVQDWTRFGSHHPDVPPETIGPVTVHHGMNIQDANLINTPVVSIGAKEHGMSDEFAVEYANVVNQHVPLPLVNQASDEPVVNVIDDVFTKLAIR